jgi:hypothetical protein
MTRKTGVAAQKHCNTPVFFPDATDKYLERKAVASVARILTTPLSRVLRPLVQKILATPYRDGATSLDYAPKSHGVRVDRNRREKLPKQAAWSTDAIPLLSPYKIPYISTRLIRKSSEVNGERLAEHHHVLATEYAQ